GVRRARKVPVEPAVQFLPRYAGGRVLPCDRPHRPVPGSVVSRPLPPVPEELQNALACEQRLVDVEEGHPSRGRVHAGRRPALARWPHICVTFDQPVSRTHLSYNPQRSASATAWVLFGQSSLARMLVTRRLAPWSEIASRRPSSLLLSPSASSTIACCSRRVSRGSVRRFSTSATEDSSRCTSLGGIGNSPPATLSSALRRTCASRPASETKPTWRMPATAPRSTVSSSSTSSSV